MRKKLILSGLLTALITLFATGQDSATRFMSDPAFTPGGDEIIFVYEGDLWKVPAEGGTAYRLTAMEGEESLPRVSPDGRWIAFSGSQDSNSNIYVVPSSGGEIKQLTFHSSFDNVDSWSWDSQYIYFTSGRMNNFSAYRVNVNGGTPERLFSGNYWNNAHFVVENPVSGEYIFSESGESFRSNNRKRYKGENNPDIKSYNPVNKQFRMLTDYEGKDLWPAVDKNGNIWFASDEGTGEYNLYTFVNGERVRLTSFTSSIGRPQVALSGDKVVFTLDYELYTYNKESKSSLKVPVYIFSNSPLAREMSFSTEGNISTFDVSPDNKKLAFVSRGRLFVSDIKGEFVREIDTDPTERVLEVKWVNDSKTLLITRTNRGWPNLYRISPEGKESEKAVCEGESTVRQLSLNSKRDKAVYYFGRDQLRMTDLKTWSDRKIVNDEFWFRGSSPGFSPDDRYVYYTAYRHFETDIKLIELKTSVVINLTRTYLTERDPFWSPDNRYLWFIADRTAASYPRGGENSRLYRIPLRKYSEPFRSDKVDELLGDSTAKEQRAFEIDTLDLLRRWESPLRVGARQSEPFVISMDTVTYVLFGSNHEGKRATYKLSIRPFGSDRIDEIKGMGQASFVTAGKDCYAISGSNIYKVNLKGNKAEKISVKHDYLRSLKAEFSQMFYEGWTVLAENYYDENMHGTDWQAMKAKYEKFLPYIRSRSDLSTLMNDMFGELNSSHMGFRSTGQETELLMKMVTAATGILFDNKNPFTVERIINMSPADNREINISKGDRLVSVNGADIDNTVSREKYFLFPGMPEEVEMVFDRAGKRVTAKVHPVDPRVINGLLYDEWIAANQERVDRLSGNRIGYVYLKDMTGGSLESFIIEMTAEEVKKDALIVDLRYNTGGNIHDDVLKFLAQRPYLEWKFREGMVSPQPHFAPSAKPIVLLVNQSSLSDAEMTAAGFKELGLGTIIGTETYRWIIFTSAATLVDGSSCRLPAWGCFSLDGTDLESSGVKPDIYIKNNFTDIINGLDPQLEKAVEVLIKKL